MVQSASDKALKRTHTPLFSRSPPFPLYHQVVPGKLLLMGCPKDIEGGAQWEDVYSADRRGLPPRALAPPSPRMGMN